MNSANKNSRCLALCFFSGGLLSAAYSGWAMQRSGMILADKHWPEPWPFPDKLLNYWERWLDVAHPSASGFIKLDGEWERLHFYLGCWLGISIMVTLCGVIWLSALSHKKP